MTIFNSYKLLKESFNFTYKGYQLKFILANDFLFYTYPNTIVFDRNVAKELVSQIDDLTSYKSILNSKVDLYSTSEYGSDHWKLLQEVMMYSNKSHLIIHSNSKKKRINILNIILSVIQCLIFWNPKNISFKTKVYYTCKCIYYKNFIDELESQAESVQIRKYISYLSATTPDSILCQFFKKHNVPTYCIQHGIFRPVEDFSSFVPLDVVNLENFQADFMLSWGEFTKSALLKSGYQNESFLLAGHPLYSNVEININPALIKTERCIVCLARDTYKDENLKLLLIASQLQKRGTKVVVKFHPRSDLNFYAKILDQYHLEKMNTQTLLSESISQYNPDFVIVYNSTVYYEYYLSGIQTFRFGLNEFDIPLGLDEDRFFTCEELLDNIAIIKNMNQEVYLNKLKQSIGHIIAYGINNYKKILENDFTKN
jgi:hypothetical protein